MGRIVAAKHDEEIAYHGRLLVGIQLYNTFLREFVERHLYHRDGTGHEFLTWRRGLHEFIPHLFKK